jgi:hypothetical protein
MPLPNPKPETHYPPACYSEDCIWKGYRAALKFDSNEELAEELGTEVRFFNLWMKRYPAFKAAIEAGKADSTRYAKAGNPLSEYLLDQLDPEVKELWNELKATDKDPLRIQIQRTIFDRGEYEQQKLLCFALASTLFDVNKCCELLGIPKSRLDTWIAADARFANLWREMQWKKQNFIESSLMGKIREGDTKAIIFANQTLNKDRGYGQELKVSGTINHVHGLIDLDKLNLDIETRAKLIESSREAGIIDVDGLVIESNGVSRLN